MESVFNLCQVIVLPVHGSNASELDVMLENSPDLNVMTMNILVSWTVTFLVVNSVTDVLDITIHITMRPLQACKCLSGSVCCGETLSDNKVVLWCLWPISIEFVTP